VHQAKSESLIGILSKLKDCKIRIGVTGTLDDVKTNQLTLKGLFGKPKRVESTKGLMEKGHLAELEVKPIVLQYSQDECKKFKKSPSDSNKTRTYQEEIDYILNHDKRNDIICSLAAKQKDNSLILFSKIEHGKILEEKLENMDIEHDVFIVHGEIDGSTREEIRQHAEVNKTIIIASYGVFSTGVNIKNLHNVIFASPSLVLILTSYLISTPPALWLNPLLWA